MMPGQNLKWIVFGVLMFILIEFNVVHGQDLNFAGRWLIDTSKTDFGGLNPEIAAPQEVILALTSDTVVVFRSFSGKPMVREVLTFDGKVVETFPDGNTLKHSSVKWLDTDTSIVFNAQYEVNGKEWEYHRTETWTLSHDKKEMTIVRVTILPDKRDKVIAIYQKYRKQ